MEEQTNPIKENEKKDDDIDLIACISKLKVGDLVMESSQFSVDQLSTLCLWLLKQPEIKDYLKNWNAFKVNGIKPSYID